MRRNIILKIIIKVKLFVYRIKCIIISTSAQTELPIELFDRLAEFIASDIKSFLTSEQGKVYYDKWIKEHPENLKTCDKTV